MSTKGRGQLYGVLARARAMLILKRKLTSGLTNAMIAKEFNISKVTVERALRKAKSEQMVERFEDQILAELVPAAITTLKQALVDGNATAAIEVMKGMGVFKKPATKGSEEANGDNDSLEVYIRSKRQPTSRLASDGQASLPRVSEQPALPAARTGAADAAPALQSGDGEDWLSHLSTVVAEGEVVGETPASDSETTVAVDGEELDG